MTTNSSASSFLDLLSDPKNVGLALQIHEHFPKVIERLQVKFWKRLYSLLRNQVEKIAGWEIEPLPSKDVELLGQYFKIVVVPTRINEAKLSCRFAIEQYRDRKQVFSLYFGICWTAETPRPPNSPEYQALSTNLAKDDYGKTNWWIGLKYLEYRVGDNAEVLEQLATGDSVEEQVATEFVELIEHYCKGAERLNASLAKA